MNLEDFIPNQQKSQAKRLICFSDAQLKAYYAIPGEVRRKHRKGLGKARTNFVIEALQRRFLRVIDRQAFEVRGGEARILPTHKAPVNIRPVCRASHREGKSGNDGGGGDGDGNGGDSGDGSDPGPHSDPALRSDSGPCSDPGLRRLIPPAPARAHKYTPEDPVKPEDLIRPEDLIKSEDPVKPGDLIKNAFLPWRAVSPGKWSIAWGWAA